MGYIYLLLTVVSESLAVVFMKSSAGFQHRLFTVFAIVCYGLSFVFLTLALKSLPAGLANAIWAGASAVLVAILGVILFGEKLSTVTYYCSG